MDQLIQYIENPIIQRLLFIVFGIVVIWSIAAVIKRIIPRYIMETNQRYRTRKFVNYMGYFLFVILIIVLYSSQFSGFTVFLGVAGAGIAFALQEVIASVAGFVVVNFSSFYKVGDRVKIGGIKGDVVDIGILRTAIMEIGDWVDGDLYNGKIVSVSNSHIFKEPVFNYSGDFPFLWDEVSIPIKTEGDHEFAREIFLDILNDIQGEYALGAAKHWAKMTEKMMIENAQVAPMVTLMFNENWITYTLRFVVDFKKRRRTKDLIFSKALQAIRKSEGRIVIASSSMEITTNSN